LKKCFLSSKLNSTFSFKGIESSDLINHHHGISDTVDNKLNGGLYGQFTGPWGKRDLKQM